MWKHFSYQRPTQQAACVIDLFDAVSPAGVLLQGDAFSMILIELAKRVRVHRPLGPISTIVDSSEFTVFIRSWLAACCRW